MIKIKYGPNPQGIREVEIQPQRMDSLINKYINKEAQKRPEHEKSKHIPKIETSKSTLAPPKKTKMVWKPKEKAPKSIPAPPKKTKML